MHILTRTLDCDKISLSLLLRLKGHMPALQCSEDIYVRYEAGQLLRCNM